MQRNSWRIIVGVLVLLMGVVALLQTLKIIPTQGSLIALFMSLIFLCGGVAFVWLLFQDSKTNWWAAIPGLSLLSIGSLIGLSELFPGAIDHIGGAIVLGGIALGFWLVYLITPRNWWAIIPGGVMLTLAAITVLPDRQEGLVPGVLFLGMALTFGLLSLITVDGKRMTWPWIPAVVLLVVGMISSFRAGSWFGYIWPAALILAGIFLLVRTFTNKS